MRNRMLLFAGASLLLGALLSGCSQYQGDLGNKNIRPNSVKYDAFGNLIVDKRFANDQMNEANRMNGIRMNSNNLIGYHKNYRMEMNEKMANEITKLDAIKSSYVIVTDHNAYVAVSLDANEPKGNAKMMSRTDGTRIGKDGVEMHRRLSTLSTGHDKLTETLKAEAAAAVRSVKPDIEHVYVSADPEFVGRMNAYMNDHKLGYPIQGYITEFNAIAERIFPAEGKRNMMQQNTVTKSTSQKKIRWIYD